jgi:hypothetical protein
MKRILIILAIALLASCSPIAGTRFQRAVDTCNASYMYADVSDGGKSLFLDHKGEEDIDGLNIKDMACIFTEIKVPTYIINQMDNTRSVDGMQRQEFDNIEISWNYHPDNGLDITLHDKNWW